MKYTAGIIGRFGFGKTLVNGQTIKTKIIASALAQELGEEDLQLADTYGGFKMLLRLPFQCLRTLRQCRNVLMMPAHRGIRVIAPMLCLFNCFFHRRLHYVVIGGWLPGMLKKRKALARTLCKFDHIFVETSTMERALADMGFANVTLLPNVKPMPKRSSEVSAPDFREPYPLAVFSRIMEEKGIADAVGAVRSVNSRLGRTVYALDLYGPVIPEQSQWFDSLQCTFPQEIRYCGLIPSDQSVSVLKDYFALLFPTKYYTEGVPGTVIDAYMAGVPVIASRWESFHDVIDEGDTGLGYPFGDRQALEDLLLRIAERPQQLLSLRENCLKKAEAFSPDVAVAILIGCMQ